MSTLTKILIVLLAFASIFLCGIVVTYVANADSYKQKLTDSSKDKDSLSNKVKELTKQINEKTDQKKHIEDKLSNEIASLNAAKSELKTKLETAEREKSSLLLTVDNLAGKVKDSEQTQDKQSQLLKDTIAELIKVQAEQVNDRVALNKTETDIKKQNDIIESLEAEKRSLMEQKAALQDKMDQMLNPGRKIVKSAVPMTTKKETAPTAPINMDAAVQGTITAIDLKNSMASVSVGKAQGVREGMRFHVTRGDEFICDIQIIDVETGEAIGVLELVQKSPQIGDIVSSNL